MAHANVLFDEPGPRGRRRNLSLSIGFGLVFVLIGVAAIVSLADHRQLAWDKWSFFGKATTWTTYLLPGLVGTVTAAIASIALALVFGVVFGVGCMSHNWFVAKFCAVIVEFFRSIPVLILMLFGYQFFAIYHVFPSKWLSFAAVIFGLTLYNGSVMAEIIRSGVHSLPAGQQEAAMSLGLSRRQAMRHVLLPQAFAAMLPAIVSQMVIALKDSALGYAIGYVEVVRSGRQLGEYYQAVLPSLIVVAAIMILINVALSRFAERVEKRLRERA